MTLINLENSELDAVITGLDFFENLDDVNFLSKNYGEDDNGFC